MKVYIAAPFFNPAQLAIVKDVEVTLEYLGINYFSPRSEGVLKSMTDDEQRKTKKHIFDSNITQMDKCTHMIACVNYKDTGTSFEIGYYYGKKPIVLYSADIGTINVMLAEAALSVCTDLKTIKLCLAGEHSEQVGRLN